MYGTMHFVSVLETVGQNAKVLFCPFCFFFQHFPIFKDSFAMQVFLFFGFIILARTLAVIRTLFIEIILQDIHWPEVPNPYCLPHQVVQSIKLVTMEYYSLWELVLVCVSMAVKRTMYQLEVDVDMLNAVKSVLADISSVSPSSEQRLWRRANTWNVSQCTLYNIQHIHINL